MEELKAPFNAIIPMRICGLAGGGGGAYELLPYFYLYLIGPDYLMADVIALEVASPQVSLRSS